MTVWGISCFAAVARPAPVFGLAIFAGGGFAGWLTIYSVAALRHWLRMTFPARILVSAIAGLAALACAPVCAQGHAAIDRSGTAISEHWRGMAGHGQVLVVNFWATWCVPCRAELPALDGYYLRHKGQGLAMLAISMDQPSKARAVRDVAAGYHFDVVMARDVTYPGRYRPTQIPVTLIFDRSGSLRFDSRRTPGLMTPVLLNRLIDPLLAEPAGR